MSPCSLLFQTREFLSLQSRTPLSTPAELPIPKTTQKYRILQMTEQAAEKLAWMRDAMRGNDTMVWSINDFGAVTGSYQNSTGHTLGFVRVPLHWDVR
jgi:hypothetical protein